MNQSQGAWEPVKGVLDPAVSRAAAKALRAKEAVVTGQTRDVGLVTRSGDAATLWHFQLSPERRGDARLSLFGQEQPVSAWQWREPGTLGDPSTLGFRVTRKTAKIAQAAPTRAAKPARPPVWIDVPWTTEMIQAWVSAGRPDSYPQPSQPFPLQGDSYRLGPGNASFQKLTTPVPLGATLGDPPVAAGYWLDVECNPAIQQAWIKSGGARPSPPFVCDGLWYAMWGRGCKQFIPAHAGTLGQAPHGPVTQYDGAAHRPWPPVAEGWQETRTTDRAASERAASMLGALPRWHYFDELQPTGLYRFFCYETPTGGDAVGALRFAGTLGSPSTLGADTLSNPNNTPEIFAAQKVLDYFSAHGCKQGYIQEVADLQTAYNVSGLGPQITQDGEYGGNTQRAMQLVLDSVQPSGGSAPENCYGMTVPLVPGLNPPGTKASTGKTMQAGMSTGAIFGIAAGALVVGGVLVALGTGYNPFARPM